jgi:predicted GNAT superfamily acetyltransferase
VHVEVRELQTPGEHRALERLFASVWRTPEGGGLHSSDLFTAIAFAGGWVGGAVRSDGEVLAGGFGFLTDYETNRLHSHGVAVHEDWRGQGLGALVKRHQIEWADAHGLAGVVWTFDPLVRANAVFNLRKLGARVVAYLPNFYGELCDGVNDGDVTDRLLVEWSTPSRPTAAPATKGAPKLVPTPDDILELRRTNGPAARDWREWVGHELGDRLRDGWTVTGLTDDFEYVVERLA